MAVTIWTTSRDLTADLVERRLKERRVEFVRLDTDRYGHRYSLCWDGSETRFTGDTGRFFTAGDITAVYYRRPSVVEVPKDERDFALHETWYFSRAALLGLKNVRWMNHPSSILEAENKLLQLEMAREVGFTVPAAIVTSNPQQAWSFFEATNRQCVCKPGYAGLIATEDGASAVYAWRVPQDLTAADFASVCSCPTFLQVEIKKTSDVRVTVVGDELFAARIFTKTPSLLDWRQELGAGLRYESILVPPGVARRIASLFSKLRLNYGAVDFAETPEGEWVFLEVNPAGQWGWLELEAGIPISDAIARWLAARM